jgi:hypothetical protein
LSRFATHEQRIAFAHGYVRAALADAWRHSNNGGTRDALARARAILDALEEDTNQREQQSDARWFYDREDPAADDCAPLPGEVGWAVGRVTR